MAVTRPRKIIKDSRVSEKSHKDATIQELDQILESIRVTVACHACTNFFSGDPLQLTALEIKPLKMTHALNISILLMSEIDFLISIYRRPLDWQR